MARDRMVTLAIVACMVSAVSALPALLISGSLQPPITNNFHETTNNVTNTTTVIPPVTNMTIYNITTVNNYTSNTNITYYVNGTLPTIERHVFHTTVVLNQTRTFRELFNITLDRKVTFTDIFVKTNDTMPGVGFGGICFESRLFLNGTRIPYYGCPSASFPTETEGTSYANVWQGMNPNWILEVNPWKMFQFGIYCYDGYNPVIPVSLEVEMYFFYEFEVMA